MRAAIAYYDPPQRPGADVRPDFATLPLTGKPATVSSMRAAGGGFSLDREGFTLAAAARLTASGAYPGRIVLALRAAGPSPYWP